MIKPQKYNISLVKRSTNDKQGAKLSQFHEGSDLGKRREQAITASLMDPKKHESVETKALSTRSNERIDSQLVNYGPFSTIQHQEMLDKRRNTAALMKSFCLYTHEQMRQMEIKKHITKALNKTTITP